MRGEFEKAFADTLPTLEALKARPFEDLGFARVVFNLESEPADKILPVIDELAALMRKVNG